MPAPGQRVELLVRDRVERPDVAAVAARQLVEPDVRALGHQHEARHPVAVGREPLRLEVRTRERRRLRCRRPDSAEPEVERRSSSARRSSPARSRAARSPGGSRPTARERSGAGRPATWGSGGPAPGASPPATRRRRRRPSRRRRAGRRAPPSPPRRPSPAATGPGSTRGRSGVAAGFSAATSSSSSDSSRSVRAGSGPNSRGQAVQHLGDGSRADRTPRARAGRHRTASAGRPARTGRSAHGRLRGGGPARRSRRRGPSARRAPPAR